MSDVEVYQKILFDLESYLQNEINEWNNLSENSSDPLDTVTFMALVDMKHEIDRLKRIYLPLQDK